MTDNQLMEQVREGKVEKLAVLFERYHVKLYNFLLRLTGNQSISEDLLQEAFFRILKYRGTFRETSRFSIWMYQIARNAHIDHLRKRKRDVPLEDQWEKQISPDPGPLEEAEANQDIELMTKALAKLPWKKREILLLSRFQNMKYKEIAELLGCQIGTVKAHVHRAIKELRTIYSDLSEEVAS